MANTIQIKRRTSAGTPSGLAAGELAVNLSDNKLYVGNAAEDGVIHLNPSASTGYLPLAGGTLTGNLGVTGWATLGSGGDFGRLALENNNTTAGTTYLQQTYSGTPELRIGSSVGTHANASLIIKSGNAAEVKAQGNLTVGGNLSVIYNGSASVRTYNGVLKSDFLENSAGANHLTIRTESGGNKNVIIDPDGTGYLNVKSWSVFESSTNFASIRLKSTAGEWDIDNNNGTFGLQWAGGDKLTLSNSGNLTVGGSVYINDTNTRIFEGGGNSVRLQTNSGYVDIGPMNSSFSHFQTDRGQFYFNKRLNVDGHVLPYTNNTFYSGLSTNRWANVYSVAGDFSGNLTVAGSCTFAAVSGTTATFSSDVGIGVASPSTKLHINNGSSAGAGAVYPLRLSGGDQLSTAGDATGIQFVQRNQYNDYGGYIRLANTQSNPNYLNPRLEFGVQNTDTNVLGSVSTKMVLDGDGRCGIGTATPHASSKLHVNGKSRFEGTIVSNVAESDTVSYGGMLAAPLHFYGAYCAFRQATNHSLNLEVYNGGTVKTAWTVLQDGNVGISTTSPATKLDVYHATDSQITVSSNSDSSGDSSLALIERSANSAFGSANTYGFQWKYDGGDNKLYLTSGNQTSIVNRLTIERDTGNVGIGGTTAPNYKLHVAATSTTLARFDGGNANNWISITSGNGYSAGIAYEDAGTAKWLLGHFNGNTDGFSFYDASTSSVKMFLKEGGNLGIGSTNPQDKLNIHDSSSSANLGLKITRGSQTHGLRLGVNDSHAFLWTDQSQDIAFANNNSEKLTIKASTGYVQVHERLGVGTASPSAKLEIYSTNVNEGVDIVGQISSANQNSDSPKLRFQGYAQTNGPFIQALNSSAYGKKRLGFFVKRSANDYTTAPTESLSIYNSGYVNVHERLGIGCDPISKLHVEGGTTGMHVSDTFATSSGTLNLAYNDASDYGKIQAADAVAYRPLQINPSGGGVIIGSNRQPDALLELRSDSTPRMIMGYHTGTNAHRLYWDSSKLYLSADHEDDVANSELRFLVDGSLKAQILSNGRFGIGVTDPDSRLEIKGAGGGNGLTLKTTDSFGNTGFWVMDGGRVGVHYNPFVVNQDYNDTDCPSNTYMYVHSASPFTIKNDGKTGIGETSPEGLLSFKANESDTPKIRFQNQHSVTTDAAISTYDDSSGTTVLIGSNLYIASNGATARFNTDEQSAGFRADRGGILQFYTGEAGATATERIRVTADGKLGLGGVTSPDGTLHVQTASAGTVTADIDRDDLVLENSDNVGLTFLSPNTNKGAIAFGDPQNSRVGTITYDHNDDSLAVRCNNTDNLLKVTSTGVGVNCTPSEKIHIVDDSDPTIRITNIDGGTNDTAAFELGVSSNTAIASTRIEARRQSDDTVDLNFRGAGVTSVAQASAQMTLTGGTGRLGLGTASPSAKIHVAASSNDGIRINSNNAIIGQKTTHATHGTQLLFWNGTDAYLGRSTSSSGLGGGTVTSWNIRTGGADTVIINSTGLAIGGVSPSAKLHVNGDSYFASDMGIGMMASSTYRLSVSDTNNTPAQFQSTTSSLNLTLGSATQTSYTNILFNSSSGNAQIWKNGGSNSDYGGTGSLNLYNSNGAIAFHPGANQNEVIIHSDGDTDFAARVGIGGAHSGSYQLYVNGTSYFNGRTTLGAAGATEGGAVINYAAFGEIKGGAQTMIGNAVVPGTANNTIQHSKSDAGNYIRMVYSEGIAFHTNITNTVNTDVAVGSSNERMRIDLNGDVDILNRLGVGGSHSGSHSLYVTGSALVSTNLRLAAGTAAGNANDPAITVGGYTNAGVYFESSGVGLGAGTGKFLFLDSNGVVDLGASKLKIGGSSGSDGQVLTTDGSGGISWTTVSSSTSGSGTVSSGTAEEVAIYKSNGTTVDGTNELYVDETNDAVNVRNHLTVNSTSLSANASYPLYVNGAVKASGYFDKSSTSYYLKPAGDTDNIAAQFAGAMFMYALSSDVSAPSGFAGIYSKYASGIARVFVSDGYHTTQISPHDKNGNWVFNSTNQKTKKRTRINMTKLIRKIEELTGEEFIMEDFVE